MALNESFKSTLQISGSDIKKDPRTVANLLTEIICINPTGELTGYLLAKGTNLKIAFIKQERAPVGTPPRSYRVFNFVFTTKLTCDAAFCTEVQKRLH